MDVSLLCFGLLLDDESGLWQWLMFGIGGGSRWLMALGSLRREAVVPSASFINSAGVTGPQYNATTHPLSCM